MLVIEQVTERSLRLDACIAKEACLYVGDIYGLCEAGQEPGAYDAPS